MIKNSNEDLLNLAKRLEKEPKEILISILINLIQLDKMNGVRVEVLLLGKK